MKVSKMVRFDLQTIGSENCRTSKLQQVYNYFTSENIHYQRKKPDETDEE